MIKCKICNKEYRRIDNGHLQKTHKISVKDYLERYPKAETISVSTRKKYAEGTVRYFKENPLEAFERTIGRWDKKTEEGKRKTIDTMKEGRLRNHNKIYGKGSVRNSRISKATKLRWASYTNEEKSTITSKSAQTTRERMGEDAYRANLAKNGIKGYKVLVKSGRGSKWEEKMLKELTTLYPDTVGDFKVGGRYYDAFIPSKNLLIEFDGNFWHPSSVDECKYVFQLSNFLNDFEKNEIARRNEYNIVRISESDLVKTDLDILITKGINE